MLRLLGGHVDVALTIRGDFPRSWPGSRASGATVETGPAYRSVVVDDGCGVGVAHDRNVYVGHRTVVVVCAVSPVAAEETDAGVAEPVVNSAIEADLRSPVAGVPHVEVAFQIGRASCRERV